MLTLKIVYLHQYFTTPDMSGGTRSYEMARRWVSAGHEVHMITSSRQLGAESAGWRITRADGIHVHWRSVPYDNSMGFSARLRAFLHFALVAGPYARKLNADVVFATSTPLTIIIPALITTALRQTPVVFEVRDLWPEIPIATGHLRNPALRWSARRLERLAYSKSRHVIALSEGMADGIVAAGKSRSSVTIAPNSCDLETFDVAAEVGESYRKSEAWIGDRTLITYLGTLGEVNDVGYIVRLAALVRDSSPEIVFAVYGSGKQEAALRALATTLGVLDSNFFLKAPVPKSEIPAILSAASIAMSVVLPLKELEANSANKFFDALASATPIAINHGGWQADLIRQEDLGVVLSPHDLQEAARDLVGLAHDQPRLSKASAAARHIAGSEFSRDVIAQRVLSAVEASVGDQRSGR